MKLELAMREGGHALPLGETPVHVGRGPANQLILSDDTVSWNHAQVWVEGGRAWVRDLGSRNGTFRNGSQVSSAVPLNVGDVLKFGKRIEGTLQAPLGLAAAQLRVLKLEEVATGTQFMLTGNRFHIGSGADAHLRTDGPARAATLMIHEDEIWVGTDDEEFQVALGETFKVAGRSMRIVDGELEHVPTVEFGEVQYPYTCRVNPNGRRGPEAWLEDPTGNSHHAEGNKAILIYLLARQLKSDRDGGVPEEEEGWLSDADVRTGIWGKGGGTRSALNVLVHRTRKQLAADGFDPWFIEKKRRGVRVRLREVNVESRS